MEEIKGEIKMNSGNENGRFCFNDEYKNERESSYYRHKLFLESPYDVTSNNCIDTPVSSSYNSYSKNSSRYSFSPSFSYFHIKMSIYVHKMVISFFLLTLVILICFQTDAHASNNVCKNSCNGIMHTMNTNRSDPMKNYSKNYVYFTKHNHPENNYHLNTSNYPLASKTFVHFTPPLASTFFESGNENAPLFINSPSVSSSLSSLSKIIFPMSSVESSRISLQFSSPYHLSSSSLQRRILPNLSSSVSLFRACTSPVSNLCGYSSSSKQLRSPKQHSKLDTKQHVSSGKSSSGNIAGETKDGVINKRELINIVSHAHSLTKSETEKIINTFIYAIETSLIEGKKITLSKFGTFSLRRRGDREARNPKTGETVMLAPASFPAFNFSKSIKEKVRNSIPYSEGNGNNDNTHDEKKNNKKFGIF